MTQDSQVVADILGKDVLSPEHNEYDDDAPNESELQGECSTEQPPEHPYVASDCESDCEGTPVVSKPS